MTMRLGPLREGDELPTVKAVVAQLAINPNTVLKAYRELEHQSLVAARPGVGACPGRTREGLFHVRSTLRVIRVQATLVD